MTSNSTRSATRRKILVAGATGKQGRALIQALLDQIPSHSRPPPAEKQNGHAIESETSSSSSDSDIEEEIIWDILALTRNATAPRAKTLFDLLPESSPHTINLVEGDVGDEASIRSIFEHENESPTQNGIWGVFVVLMFPGLGVKNVHLEVKQGKVIHFPLTSSDLDRFSPPTTSPQVTIPPFVTTLTTPPCWEHVSQNLAGLAFEFNVAAFVYSSTLPPGKAAGEPHEPSYQDKFDIEQYCQELGRRNGDNGGGLNWVIVRPGFFMENFDGLMGAIALTVFREGLTDDAAVPMISSKDIGRVVAGVFKNPKKYIHKFLALTSGAITMREMECAYQRATGDPMPSIPVMMAKFILRMNVGSQTVVNITQRSCDTRKKGEYYAEFGAEIEMTRSVCRLQNYEEWKKSELELVCARRTEVEPGWNQTSLWKLLTGQS